MEKRLHTGRTNNVIDGNFKISGPEIQKSLSNICYSQCRIYSVNCHATEENSTSWTQWFVRAIILWRLS